MGFSGTSIGFWDKRGYLGQKYGEWLSIPIIYLLIVKALIKFFTFVGLPKSLQSDQGSNFIPVYSNRLCMN